MPDEVREYRRRFLLVGHPRLEFLPKGDRLIVSWVLNVYTHSIGHNQTEASVMILDPKYPYQTESGETHGMSLHVAISPNSKKVAIEAWTRRRSSVWQHRIYIVSLTDSGATVGTPGWIDIPGVVDCVFAFSPDSRQLATTDQVIERRNKQQNDVLIRLIDISKDDFPSTWSRPYWPEVGLLARLRRQYSIYRSCHLTFGIWGGRWIATIWDPFARTLNRHDLSSPLTATAPSLSSIETLATPTVNLAFSNNLNFAASLEGHASNAFLRTVTRNGDKQASDGLITVVDVKTDKVVCLLRCDSLDAHRLSYSGEYIIARKKKKLRVFRVLGD